MVGRDSRIIDDLLVDSRRRVSEEHRNPTEKQFC